MTEASVPAGLRRRRPTAVERAASGDREAFAALVRRHDEGLRALAYRLLGDRDRMDDALQEAYVRAFRGLPRFRGDSAFGTWLYRIAYNTCLDELERGRREAAVRVSAAPEAADPGGAVAERASERADLAAALASLQPADRVAVLLVDAQGFDYESAARILGVPAGTIGSRLNRARAALRRELRPTEEGHRQ
jgi:RNA polymerase sigma-70 factor (ECF subfamily)